VSVKTTAPCDTCHTKVSRPTEQVTILHELSRDDYFYRFICPQHNKIIFKGCEEKIARFLLDCGASFETVDVDRERQEEGLPEQSTDPEDTIRSKITDFLIDLNVLDSGTIIDAARDGR
jgi:hypothetical protein